MDRRRFLLTSLAGVLAAPRAAEAQQVDKIARIGYLAANLVANPRNREAFRQGLHDLGYVEGRNVVIEYRDAAGKLERFPALAAELVTLKVDVFFAAGATPAALAAEHATRTSPLSSLLFPIRLGAGSSLALRGRAAMPPGCPFSA